MTIFEEMRDENEELREVLQDVADELTKLSIWIENKLNGDV